MYYEEFSTPAGLPALLAGLGALWILIVALCILVYVAMWKIFAKAHLNGYEGLIPGHSRYQRLILSGIPGYYYFLILLSCIPFIGWIIYIGLEIWWSIEFAKSFGRSEGFGVGLALLPVIFYPILAFGDAQYIGPQAGKKTNNSNVVEAQKVETEQKKETENQTNTQSDIKEEPAETESAQSQENKIQQEASVKEENNEQ